MNLIFVMVREEVVQEEITHMKPVFFILRLIQSDYKGVFEMAERVGGEVVQLRESNSSVNVDLENVSIDSTPTTFVFSGWRKCSRDSVGVFELVREENKREMNVWNNFRISQEEHTNYECEDSNVESDTDSDLSSMRARVLHAVRKRALVRALPAVSVVTNTEIPVRSSETTPVIVDREACIIYMQGWRARAKQLRIETRANAKMALLHSPRIAARNTYNNSFGIGLIVLRCLHYNNVLTCNGSLIFIIL